MKGYSSLAIALTYCGAVIGAGFATGREVVTFFSVYGNKGLVGVLLAVALFSWVGVVILDVTHRKRVYSYLQLLECILVKKTLVILADILFLGTLLGGAGVMTALGGTILHEWGLNYALACAVFLAICLLVLRHGSDGFVRANSFLVPGLVVAISLISLLQISAPVSIPVRPGPVPSAILYVAFNTAMAAVALTTLKSKLTTRSALYGGLLGGLLIGGLLVLVFFATMGVTIHEIPMLALAGIWLGKGQWIYKLVLLAAVMTTALANIHGLASRVAQDRGYWPVAMIIAAIAFLIALFGFGTLVDVLYPLLGLCNIVLLLGLCYYSLRRFKI